jgi:16S rRNA (guanine527-N7)-methyltransferase
MKWNARMNLTAARKPEEIVRRHFVESIFAAQQIPKHVKTLLDFGSGAGFPGIPIAICRPKIGVTLAESQGKKAAFLREAVRTLGLKAEVWAGRVEEMAMNVYSMRLRCARSTRWRRRARRRRTGWRRVDGWRCSPP